MFAADQARRARRHDRRRRLSVADPRRYVGASATALDAGRSGARLMFMKSSGGLTAADAVRRQGRDPVRPGRRRRRHGAHRASAGLRQGRSASTWAAPRPTSRISPASYERAFETEVAGVRMRAPMMSDPHGRGRRRLDPAFRRRALPRRAGFGGRRSRPGMLPPRRPARRHRRQCDGRQARARLLSQRSSARRSDAAARRRGACARPSPRWRREIGDGRARRGRRRRLHRASRSPRWRTRSRRSRSRAATTSPATR